MTNDQKSPSVQQIILAFVGGDTKQYRILKNQIAKYAYTHHYLSTEAKEDVISDTLAALLRNFRDRRFRGDTHQALNVYIYMIVRNTVSNHLRQTNVSLSPVEVAELEDQTSTPADTKVANQDLISKILSQIEEKCAAMLKMKFQWGLSNQEVADQLTMTKNAASTAISRCLDRAKNLKIIRDLL